MRNSLYIYMHIYGPIQPCINQIAISSYDINGDVVQQWIIQWRGGSDNCSRDSVGSGG